ncbi:histidine phosphatase family protein [Allosphingosinicella sp.]|uniref:histidine phosphatase family protein n=1 Tax=Allosphingosinicella sp. TaxID=2823234 RepID=UPI0037841BF6
MRTLIALLLAMLPAATFAQPSTHPVYVMRHLNTPAGEPDPDLLPEGRAAAIALADLMETDQFQGARRPVAIYVSDYKRTRQTAAPLAARLALNVTVYDPRDTAGLLARVRAEAGPVLIVGHSNTVPDIVAALGGTRPAPLVHEDFGDLWVVEPGGATTKLRLVH